MRVAKTKQTTDCEQNKQTKQSSGQLTAKNPEENKQTKQCKQHTSKSIHRQMCRDQGADLGFVGHHRLTTCFVWGNAKLESIASYFVL